MDARDASAGWIVFEQLSGTVTFLFTDIEGSTSLRKQLDRARYGELLARQQLLFYDANTGAPGTLARFTDTGLVYADDARPRLLAFAQLPSR